MLTRRLLLVGLCLAVSLGGVGSAARADATLYRWVDKDGITHYSDRPAPGAEKVQIVNAQTYRGGAVRTAPGRPGNPKAVRKSYTRAEVTFPADGETIANTGGSVSAAAAVEPPLVSGHQLWFVLDGARLDEPAPSLSATLSVERGTHTLAVVITDESGNDLISSAPISFIYRQNAAAAPPRGPLLPPPKKP
jgi:hypothetical protein